MSGASARDCTNEDFKIVNMKADGNQLQVDIVLRPPPYLELTFERSHIEGKLGIPWDYFVRTVNEVMEEMEIQVEKEGYRDEKDQGLVR